MRFVPPRCPHPPCSASQARAPFPWRRKGFYPRRCDGRRVQRFLCLTCKRGFSTQTFRLDYGLRRPSAAARLLDHFISKVTLRQSARTLRLSRKLVAHRQRLLGRHCQELQRRLLDQVERRGGLQGSFQLDELETYENDRRLEPLTVPVLIEERSYFVLSAEPAPLPCRGGLSPRHREKKRRRELLFGVRRSGSTKAVTRCFQALEKVAQRERPVRVRTDQKTSYQRILKKIFGERLVHQRIHARLPRGYKNPLFPINHTLAMLRDGLSRLVRRTWAASKKSERLEHHLWIWIAWRNFVRGITNAAQRTTPAMALGVLDMQLAKADLLRWKARFAPMLLGA